MKSIQQTLILTFIFLTLITVTGCDTPLGKTLGKFVVINDQPANEFFKGVLAQMTVQQQAQLKSESPQTLQTIKHNDAIAQQQQQPAPAAVSGQPSPPVEAPIPLKVEDIKAMAAAGIKTDVIVDEIKLSKARYSAADIQAAQQANVDPSVIECMKENQLI
jgi:hypothetical protein